jgi:hypothetical protein
VILPLIVCISAYMALAFAMALALIGMAGVAADAVGILPSSLVAPFYGSALIGTAGANIIAHSL